MIATMCRYEAHALAICAKHVLDSTAKLVPGRGGREVIDQPLDDQMHRNGVDTRLDCAKHSHRAQLKDTSPRQGCFTRRHEEVQWRKIAWAFNLVRVTVLIATMVLCRVGQALQACTMASHVTNFVELMLTKFRNRFKVHFT